MSVEHTGTCDGEHMDKRRIKLMHAKEYGGVRQLSPSMAHDAMRVDKIPQDLWPSEAAHKWQKRIHKKMHAGPSQRHYTAWCLESLRLFLKNPPENVEIFPDWVC